MSEEKRTIPLKREFPPGAIDCPLAPPRDAGIHARTLHRACLILGGIDLLARHLGIPVADLRNWLSGTDQPPEPIFFACVEIVLLHAEGPAQANE
jgi:hypothetical protein